MGCTCWVSGDNEASGVECTEALVEAGVFYTPASLVVEEEEERASCRSVLGAPEACSLVWPACSLASVAWVERRVSCRREARASGRLAWVGWVAGACTEAQVGVGDHSLVWGLSWLVVVCTLAGLVEVACTAS